MEKLLVVLIAMLTSSLFAFGQEPIFQKGDILISGITGASFSSNSLKPDVDGAEKFKINHFALNGGAGYFITDRISVGGLLVYMNVGLDDQLPIDKISMVGFNAFGRYYVIPPVGVSSLGFYGQVNLGMNRFAGGDLLKASGPAYGGATGVNYFISKTVSLDCSLNYSLISLKIDDSDVKIKGGTLNFLVGISVKL